MTQQYKVSETRTKEMKVRMREHFLAIILVLGGSCFIFGVMVALLWAFQEAYGTSWLEQLYNGPIGIFYLVFSISGISGSLVCLAYTIKDLNTSMGKEAEKK